MLWLGENTTLVCGAVGNPVPNMSYSVLGENASVVYSKTLVIKISSVTYVKMYTCTAFNGVQPPVSVNATVTVLGKCFTSHICFPWFFGGDCFVCVIQWK